MALSRSNSSTAPLAGGAVFTGTAEDVVTSASWEISVYSVGTSGSLVAEHSADAATWTTTDTFAVADGSFLRVSRNVVARYFRCAFTNGAGTQTEFRLTTRHSGELVSAGAASAGQPADAEDSGMVVFAIRDDALSTLTTAENEYVPLRVGSTGAVHVDGSAATQPVSGTVTIGAGTAAIGKLSANSGVDIGDVDVASVTPGTSATNLGKAEDTTHSSGDVGVMSLAVRNDTRTALAGTDGDYAPLQVDSAGALRSVLSGATAGGVRLDVPVDTVGRLQTALPLSAFGEVVTTQLHPEVQVTFGAGVDVGQYLVSQSVGTGASASSDGSMASMTSGTSNSGFSRVSSVRFNKYRAGTGERSRYTTLFDTPATNNTQICGPGDVENGFFFSYVDTTFGILHRKNGKRCIQTLTVTTGSSNAENITITLDGDALATVAVTNNASTSDTAAEIAFADYSSVSNDGWDAYNVDSTVVFVARAPGARAGAFTLSSATSAVGTFAETRAGAAPTETHIAQTAWNIDVMDGGGGNSNPSGVTLVPTFGNVYQVLLQWLGFGAIVFSVEEPATGALVPVHRIQYSNANTDASVFASSFPLLWESRNSASGTSSVTIKGLSGSIFNEGLHRVIGPKLGTTATVSDVDSGNVHHSFTIRNRAVLSGVINRSVMRLLKMSAAAAGGTGKPEIIVRFHLGGTVTYVDTPVFTEIGTLGEISTTTTTLSDNGDVIVYVPVAINSNISDNIADLNIILNPGESLVVSVEATTGTNHTSTVGMTWVQDI